VKFLKKIKDERLLLLQLKNTRIVYIFQTLSITALLVYYGFRDGFVNVTKNPLWLIWLLSAILMMYLQMGISVDVESEKKKKQGPYYEKVLLSLAIGIIIGIIMVLSGNPIRDSIIIGFVFFICYLIPSSIIHYLRRKRSQELDD
jgi:UDP-N-acetylmuramyl pentapeptide phosphotransferase/UDP-N-acetylglucosamine-1-phosphate transferase